MTWAARAECRNHDAEWWHSDDVEIRELAMEICSTCTVQVECLREWQSLDNKHARHGIWAGMEAKQLFQTMPRIKQRQAQ